MNEFERAHFGRARDQSVLRQPNEVIEMNPYFLAAIASDQEKPHEVIKVILG
jgi:hypothetical protein